MAPTQDPTLSLSWPGEDRLGGRGEGGIEMDSFKLKALHTMISYSFEGESAIFFLQF